MLWVALALAAGWALTTVVFARVMERSRREHARREDLLVNQMCALAGRPWQEPPAFESTLETPKPPEWIGDPEQVIE